MTMTRTDLKLALDLNKRTKLEILDTSKNLLAFAAKIHCEETNVEQIDFDIDNGDAPSVNWYMNDEDTHDMYIKSVSFTDNGEIDKFILWSPYTDDEIEEDLWAFLGRATSDEIDDLAGCILDY